MKLRDAITPLFFTVAFLMVIVAAGCLPAYLPVTPMPSPPAETTPPEVVPPPTPPVIEPVTRMASVLPKSMLEDQEFVKTMVQPQLTLTNKIPNAWTLSWGYPTSITNAEFAIYSKQVLNSTNDWEWVGTVTNVLSTTIGMKRASGKPITNVYFKVLCFKL